MKPVRVLIVEDSAVMSELLCAAVRHDPRLEYAGCAATAEQALRVLQVIKPDVISMDLCLPGMDGIEATRRIMAERPTPIVIVSAFTEEPARAMEALRAGGLSVVDKPGPGSLSEHEKWTHSFCTQLFIMSGVKLIRRVGRLPAKPRGEAPAWPRDGLAMVGIVASTGGPCALVELLNGLPWQYAPPIAVVQHINHEFLPGFAEWLAASCPFRVGIAEHGETPKSGHVYLAAASVHLRMEGGRFALVSGPKVSGHQPSGDVLFESMARFLPGRSVGILLTGMGEDGARGLLSLRSAGGYTIAEDELTATVYGMPKAAVKLGGACESLPLNEIAARLASLFGTRGAG